MRRRYSPFYFIGQGFQGLFRNGVMSFASIAVLMSCLLVLGSFTLLVQNLNKNLEAFALLNEIVVFVDRDADEEKMKEIEEEILALDNVAAVKRTTKAESLEKLKAQAEDGYEGLYEGIDETNNPLTDYFTITYEDSERSVNLSYQLQLMIEDGGIYKVVYHHDLSATIDNFKSGVLNIFTGLLIVLFIVSLFVIINTVKLSVFSRRGEISIMRYVGATRWFVVLPFLIEGIIIGLVSGILSYFLEVYFYTQIQVMALSKLQMITLIPLAEVQMPLLWGFLAVGVIAGTVGSSISLGKYLKA